MERRINLWCTIASLGLCLVVTACGGGKQNAQSLASRYANEFKSAPPDIKTSWDTALAAAQTNGYAVAIGTLQMLRLQPGLTPKQIEAVNQAVSTLSDQMYAAVNKGDANAENELNELRKLRGR